MDAILCRGLRKSYGDVSAVNGLELSVKHGELFSLLGVNGAGKSSTVRMLCCLAAPTGGDAFILGHSVVYEAKAVKELIAVSPQETAIAANLSVRENLELMCGVHGFSEAKAEKKIAELSGRLGLNEVSDRRAGKLSGGWQRRLSIAMALVSEPRVLFLDEPTLGLDVLARSELWELILSLKGETTVLLTTHYMEEAERLSDRIGIMKDGRLAAVGTADELRALAGEERFEDAFVSIVRGCGT